MREGQTAVTRRLDYAPPAFWIDTVDLTIDLDPAKTRVLSKLVLRRNPDVPAQPLKLDGDELNLARVLLDGAGCSFRMEGQQLVLENLPEGDAPFALEIFTTCSPEKNSRLTPASRIFTTLSYCRMSQYSSWPTLRNALHLSP